jgi:hypothetical protein
MTPTERLARAYVDGLFRTIPCTCQDACPETCCGECGCKACAGRASEEPGDSFSGEILPPGTV